MIFYLMQMILKGEPDLWIVKAMVEELVIENGILQGVRTNAGEFLAGSVVITTGTFLNGLIHQGENRIKAGRINEPPSVQLSFSLADCQLELGRLKTGTPARLDKRAINWDDIPYAQPPIENLRWKAPREVKANSNIIKKRDNNFCAFEALLLIKPDQCSVTIKETPYFFLIQRTNFPDKELCKCTKSGQSRGRWGC